MTGRHSRSNAKLETGYQGCNGHMMTHDHCAAMCHDCGWAGCGCFMPHCCCEQFDDSSRFDVDFERYDDGDDFDTIYRTLFLDNPHKRETLIEFLSFAQTIKRQDNLCLFLQTLKDWLPENVDLINSYLT